MIYLVNYLIAGFMACFLLVLIIMSTPNAEPVCRFSTWFLNWLLWPIFIPVNIWECLMILFNPPTEEVED